MDHADENVKRIADLEAEVAELKAAIAERDAMTATAVKLARQAALNFAAHMLLSLARRGSVSLAEAARLISDTAAEVGKLAKSSDTHPLS